MNEQHQHEPNSAYPARPVAPIDIGETEPVPGTRRHRGVLYTVLVASVALHVAALMTFGSIAVFTYVFRDTVTFAPPPPAKKSVSARLIQYKASFKEQQRRGGRPPFEARISAASIYAPIQLPSIPDMITPATTKLFPNAGRLAIAVDRSLSDGLGSGPGSGSSWGLGNCGQEIPVLGFPIRTERIAILLDMSPSMLEDRTGGVSGYAELKRQVGDIVDSMAETTLFSLIAFADGVDICHPKMQAATPSAKAEAKEWLGRYMANAKNPRANGLLSRNYNSADELPNFGGETRTDLALCAAFEQQADAIVIVSDGNHRIYREFTNDERKRHERETADVDPEEWRSRNAEYEKEWAEQTRARAKRGLSEKVLEVRGRGPGRPIYNDNQVIDWLGQMAKRHYTDNKLKMPRIHVYAYVANPSELSFLKTISKDYSGRIHELKPFARPIEP